MLPRSLCSQYMLSLSWTGEQAGAELVWESGGPGGSWEGWQDEESGKNFSTPPPSHFTTSRVIISSRSLWRCSHFWLCCNFSKIANWQVMACYYLRISKAPLPWPANILPLRGTPLYWRILWKTPYAKILPKKYLSTCHPSICNIVPSFSYLLKFHSFFKTFFGPVPLSWGPQ